MLARDAILDRLGHPSRHVRAAVARYVGHRGPPDAGALRALLGACERHGVAANRAALWHFVGAAPGEAEAARALRLLREAGGRDDRFALLRLLGTSAAAAFGAWGGRLDLDCPDERALHEAMARRRALAERPGPELWTTLLQLGARHGPHGPADTGPEDDAGALVAALLTRDDLPDGALLAAMDDPRLQSSWIGGHLFELAARRRLRTAVPRFAAALGGDGPHRAAIRGLGLLADARAVALLAALCPRRERAFRLDAAEALGRIQRPESESAIVRLLGAEDDDDVRAALCVALCRLFSIAGLEVVRGELTAGRSPLRVRLDGSGEPIDVGAELTVASLVVDDTLAERARRRLAAAG